MRTTRTSFISLAPTAAGDLDPTFGIDGVARVEDPDLPGCFLTLSTLATDLSQKIYVAGRSSFYPICFVSRLLENGRIDSGFGCSGYVRLPGDPAEHSPFYPTNIVSQEAGKITFLGHVITFTDDGLFQVPAACRVTSEGRVDEAFGEGGLSIFRLPVPADKKTRTGIAHPRQGGLEHAVLLNQGQPRGGGALHSQRIVRLADGNVLFLAELMTSGGQHVGAYLVKMDSDGNLDLSFGGKGYIQVRFGFVNPPTRSAFDVDDQGRIIIVGSYSSVGIVARYDALGQLDNSFGNHGMVQLTNPGGACVCNAVKVLLDGKIAVLAALFGGAFELQAPALIQLLCDGRRDLDFNHGAPAIADLGPYGYFGVSLDQDNSGRLLIAGARYMLNWPYIEKVAAMSRFMPRGVPDDSFGRAGHVVHESLVQLYAMAVQERAKILAITQDYESVDYSYSIVRFFG